MNHPKNPHPYNPDAVGVTEIVIQPSDKVFGRMLFIYAKDGRVKCYSAEEIRPIESAIKEDGWHHTATIDPARWIEAMANGNEDPSDILDEIQFKQNPKDMPPEGSASS